MDVLLKELQETEEDGTPKYYKMTHEDIIDTVFPGTVDYFVEQYGHEPDEEEAEARQAHFTKEKEKFDRVHREHVVKPTPDGE